LGKVIAIANQKGGVGKTTTAISLGAALAKQDMWTLVMDCDPQANTTGGLGFPRDPARRSIYHALMHDVPLKDLVLKCAVEGLHLIPSEKNLVGAPVELVDQPEREQVLRKKMIDLRNEFNFILLDCPPSLDLLTLNALVAADTVIVPVQCEYFALEGVSELTRHADSHSPLAQSASGGGRNPFDHVRRAHQPFAPGARRLARLLR
jgi:chromosome partitioning protein